MNTTPKVTLGMQAEPPVTSPHMARIVQQLAAAVGVDLSQPGAALCLTIPSRPERWLIANLDGQRISVTHCWVEAGALLALDLDMVFSVSPDGWEPVEIVHAPTLWATYVHAAQAAGLPVLDAAGNMHFACFTEYWATQLQAQGWLRQAHCLPDSPWLPADDAPSGRMAGCQSTNHTQCYGELWQCCACGKFVCFAEGTDDQPEICDDCWVKDQAERMTLAQGDDHVPF
jgi:hypothetical protein